MESGRVIYFQFQAQRGLTAVYLNVESGLEVGSEGLVFGLRICHWRWGATICVGDLHCSQWLMATPQGAE